MGGLLGFWNRTSSPEPSHAVKGLRPAGLLQGRWEAGEVGSFTCKGAGEPHTAQLRRVLLCVCRAARRHEHWSTGVRAREGRG